mmetsp:Transcript_9256/g.16316  ORF Transcript_9256/g.16316 Transcript_9256/m.16316 type:complete len:660 (-) Transcript_9256:759-2738(-)|eukprot:CAMPEP_0119107430 /NCGR_PEP_ID=MMETSP1180-20130426/10085_1 /TAXON_ID=3052 ORGANISM="Chlamydomonas cf sp, Strain CCMP681" /NCGR_SAMPLE_ID=MMETSP1180 /ASSEMBLY_ACC=CAM_ASM_000741 /LENGTH=659 /DNA_ID=CAMNT_0007092915 /DNA_START=29 /DNA_END=2008 /DNA_ORIENTATION=+
MEKHMLEVGAARAASADGKVPSAGPIFRHAGSAEYPKLEVTTLFDLFTRSAEKYADNKCLGSRTAGSDGKVGPFSFRTYSQVSQEVTELASGLRAIGVQPKQRVGILGPNCASWMVAMQACNRMSMHCVPLYDSLGENAIEFIINHSEAVVAFVDTAKMPGLVKALDHTHAVLKTVVYWGPGDAALQKSITDKGYKVYSMDEVVALGVATPAEPVPPGPEDLATIMYTSGTTGEPKGVMLKHSAVLAGVCSAIGYCKVNNIEFKAPDSMLSYLPLAHIFDRVNEEAFLYLGCSIGYWQGDVTKLVGDLGELKPALFIAVPRVLDRIYTGMSKQVKEAGFIKSTMFNWGFKRKLHFMRQGIAHNKAAPFFDKIVFSKLLPQRLGGNVKIVVSGGAPLAPHVEEFLRVTVCAPVVQGYGLTETSAASFIASATDDKHEATVGPPTPCTEFRLESVPDMNYDATSAVEPKGEVLIRGPANFTGYYKAQAMTDEVLEADGWFHTGDIGVISKDGALKIIDRKKNIFKLSQGEYVAVEKLENVFKKCTLVDQVWVYGHSLKNCLVAFVVPGPGLQVWATEQGIKASVPELYADAKVKAYLLAELNATGKADKLKGFEMIKALHIEPTLWSVEDNLLTPTFKLKRPQLKTKYQATIDALYASVGE